jgi:hypothetical protein
MTTLELTDGRLLDIGDAGGGTVRPPVRQRYRGSSTPTAC